MLLHAAGAIDSPDAARTLTYFACKTGETFKSLGKLEEAESLFAQGAEDAASIISQAVISPGDADLCVTLFCTRARCAWSLQQHALATSLLEKAADVLRRCSNAPSQIRAELAARLASSYIDLARTLLAESDEKAPGAVPLLLSAVGVTAAVRSEPDLWLSFDGGLHFKALRFLAIAHIKSSNHELALTCVRTMAADAAVIGRAAAPVVEAAQMVQLISPFITISALCGLGRLDEAEERLASMCRDGAALESSVVQVDLTLDAISLVVKAGRPQAAAAAVIAVLKAVPRRIDAVVRFLDLTLGSDEQLGNLTREAALSLLIAPECVDALKTAAQNEPPGGPARQALSHAIAVVWNAASLLFQRKQYEFSRELFAAVMSYQLAEDGNRPKAARAACLCHLALKQPKEALRYIRLADELESGGSPSIQTKFLLMKVHLECGGDDEDALKALEAMTLCADFDPDFLLLVALESQSAQALRCAQQAYTLLYGHHSNSGTAPAGVMAHLLRHLIQVTDKKWDAADAATVAHQGRFERGRSDELAQQFVVAAERLSTLGASAFAGDDAVTAATECAWFGLSAWNAGLATIAPQEGIVPAWGAAVHLFRAAGTFMSALFVVDPHDQQGAVSPHTCQLAWLLSAASALEADKDAKNTASDGPQGLLAEAASALQHAAAVEIPAADAARAQVFMLLTGFTVKAKCGDAAGCLDMLRTAEAMPGLTTDTALKLAKIAAEDAGPAVALRAYELCMRVMQRSQSGLAANYADMAHVLRRTLTYAEQSSGSVGGGADSHDARLLRYFREAAALMASVPPGAYPPEEAEWLMTSAWNRGAMLIKLGRVDAGELFLKVGLELQRHAAKHSPGAETHKAAMLDALAKISSTRAPGR